MDACFSDRVHDFIKIFFGSKGLEHKWCWFRVEYQARGAAHVHGYLRLKEDPGITELSQKALEGRKADHKLRMLIELETQDINYEFEHHMELEDEWIPVDLIKKHQIKEHITPLTPEQVEEHLLIIQEGKRAHDVICMFHEWLFTSIHPEPPEDAEANERNNFSQYMQTCNPTICHPCAIDPRTMFQMSSTERKNKHCKTINTVERHMCTDYCDKNSAKRAKKRAKLSLEGTLQAALFEDPLLEVPIKCRFDHPKELNDMKTHVKICETLTTHVEDVSLCELDYEIDIVPLRNDRWLVSHPRHLLESWQANIDFQLIVDIKKVLRYMTKYATKCESTMTKGIAAMMRNVLRKTIADGLSVQTALKRVMGKILGQRMLSKQETTKLTLSLPMVSCSHVFALINLDDN